MSKLPVFVRFLSVGTSLAKTQVVFQAKTQAKKLSIELRPSREPPRGRRRAPLRLGRRQLGLVAALRLRLDRRRGKIDCPFAKLEF